MFHLFLLRSSDFDLNYEFSSAQKEGLVYLLNACCYVDNISGKQMHADLSAEAGSCALLNVKDEAAASTWRNLVKMNLLALTCKQLSSQNTQHGSHTVRDIQI